MRYSLIYVFDLGISVLVKLCLIYEFFSTHYVSIKLMRNENVVWWLEWMIKCIVMMESDLRLISMIELWIIYFLMINYAKVFVEISINIQRYGCLIKDCKK